VWVTGAQEKTAAVSDNWSSAVLTDPQRWSARLLQRPYQNRISSACSGIAADVEQFGGVGLVAVGLAHG